MPILNNGSCGGGGYLKLITVGITMMVAGWLYKKKNEKAALTKRKKKKDEIFLEENEGRKIKTIEKKFLFVRLQIFGTGHTTSHYTSTIFFFFSYQFGCKINTIALPPCTNLNHCSRISKPY